MSENVKISLSPPEFQYANEIKYSVGNDPNVVVAPLVSADCEGECDQCNCVNTINVIVTGQDRAEALATLLKRERDFGGIRVVVQVINSQGEVVPPLPGPHSAGQIVQLFRTGLSTNRYFRFVVAQPTPTEEIQIFPIFAKEVIQFYNDDISDYFNNFNEVAARVFRNVMRERISDTLILYSTDER